MDAYDQAIDYFKLNSEKIEEAWDYPGGNPGGCLFGFVGPNPDDPYCGGSLSSSYVGCLTQVRHAGKKAFTEELTEAIRVDDRIPNPMPDYHWSGDLTWDTLPVFADWQRRIDAELERTPPPLNPDLPEPTTHYTAEQPAKFNIFAPIYGFFKCRL